METVNYILLAICVLQFLVIIYLIIVVAPLLQRANEQRAETNSLLETIRREAADVVQELNAIKYRLR
jgi:type II secretory pathway component PulM